MLNHRDTASFAHMCSPNHCEKNIKFAQNVGHEQAMCMPKNGSGRVHNERVGKIQTSAILSGFTSSRAAERGQPRAGMN